MDGGAGLAGWKLGGGEGCAGGVLGAERGRCGEQVERPGDVEGGVVPEEAAFAGRVIEVGGLVEHLGGVGEDEEAVGEAGGDPEELERIWAEVESGPLPEVGGLGAQVDGDVPDMAGEDANELSLGLFELVVESAKDALGGTGLVILDEAGGQIERGKRILVINFSEPTATIPMATGLDELNVLQRSVDKGHMRQFARVLFFSGIAVPGMDSDTWEEFICEP